jgi:hypothetical protein
MQYEIWSEGFATKSGKNKAHLMGKSFGGSFQEACDMFFKGSPLYNSAELTHWGCKLYDNETQARQKFG